MEYAIKDIAQIIKATTNQLHDDTISILLTDSRRLSFPEKSLFFALTTKTNDGHKFIPELYNLRVRNFVVSEMLPSPAGGREFPDCQRPLASLAEAGCLSP